MASFQHPFQCLQYVNRLADGQQDVLVASAGRHLYTYDAATGQRLDVWPQDVDTSESAGADSTEAQAHLEKEQNPSSVSKEQAEQQPAPKKGSKDKGPAWSNIPLVVVSLDGKYVAAVTAEDKCIRVFTLSEEGKLQELSSRTMPKRPSALTLNPDGQTLLCGDKFGDAYSLPLIPGDYVKRAEVQHYKPLGPAATSLTVHTKRNLLSLEQQRQQLSAEKKAAAGEKEALNFEHQLIIGHVSVLLDLISASVSGESPDSRARSYILTADRDEHIRVSRGLPQAHVIEQYCLGHTSFVSKLCIPSWAPKVLVSGGGDGYLIVWNWTEGQIMQKISLDEVVQTQDVIVRGIWEVSLQQPAGPVNAILVGLEGLSQLLSFTLEDDHTLKFQGTIQLSGNVFDVTGIPSKNTVAVCVDTIREPNSTNMWKSSPGTPQTLIETFQVSSSEGSLSWSPADDSMVTEINLAGTTDLPVNLEPNQKKVFDDSLYTLVNLRKMKFYD
ncbi:uncharacterized protein N7498_001423 [Penicillium cinerascens]|uniref:Transfer RNA methyltransferase 82 n=1 Tax=Penicillium cinerascens TaxID=70096 RepID=A0A9W9NIK2_9EURO|nr:uncharacterized protein N7498_001423 [Penicillium cinerascens]KAJ5219324.1 hypothetical protein N7498_001423 [Penicillium cinerascens]